MDIPTPIVNLDPLEGKQTTYLGYTVKRSSLSPRGKYKYAEMLEAFGESIYHIDMFMEQPVCFEHVIIVGFSLHSLGAFKKYSRNRIIDTFFNKDQFKLAMN